MASNNLRFLLNLQKEILFRNHISLTRSNTTRSLATFSKINRNPCQNYIRLIQKRLETTQSQQKPNNTQATPSPKSPRAKSSPFLTLSKYLFVFIGGVIGYYAITMYVDFFEDEADTSPEALKFKPGIIKEVSKKVSFVQFHFQHNILLFSILDRSRSCKSRKC